MVSACNGLLAILWNFHLQFSDFYVAIFGVFILQQTVFKDKQGGLIVDYIGIAEKLKEALSQYTESDKKTTGLDTEVAAQVLLEKYDLIKEMLLDMITANFLRVNRVKK